LTSPPRATSPLTNPPRPTGPLTSPPPAPVLSRSGQVDAGYRPAPGTGQAPLPFSAPEREAVAYNMDDAPDIDWISVGLGLLALISVGGLIVLWFFIYLRWTTPIL